MGYYIYQHETEFHIKKENFEKALAAIYKIAEEEIESAKKSKYPDQNPQFGWTSCKTLLECKTLADALIEWGWEPICDDSGDISDIQFSGEKLGEEEVLFKTLAPFVEKDSFIVIEGSDSKWWKWLFDGKTLIEKPGKVVFED
jgi:hypothetical protein